MIEHLENAQAQFAGKVVLVTGAGRGLGRAIALAFARQGAVLAVNDLTPINLDETVSQIRALGTEVKDYVFDVARKMPAEELVSEVLEDYGGLDILISHAAVHPHMDLLEMDEWDFRRTMDVNLSAAFFMTQLAGRVMRSQAGGVIINIGADIGTVKGQQESVAFWVSKMGLIGLTVAAAKELAPYNIRVNAVIPGARGHGLRDLSETQVIRVHDIFSKVRLSSNEPQGEITDLMLYVCSQAGNHLNGHIINA